MNDPLRSRLTENGFGPFYEKTFRVLWTGAFVSNIGTWMQNVGVSWLAATLSSSALTVALIQVASSLPALFLSYPAGVLSDHTDKRKLLIWLQLLLFLTLLILSMLTIWHLLSMPILVTFTFLVGIGSALTTPVWQAVTPEVVSSGQMKSAIALNGVSFNLSRAIGPALGGVMLAYGGIQSVFLFNALSFLALTAGLYQWKNQVGTPGTEGFAPAFKDGLREVSGSGDFKKLIVRTISFTTFISAIFALLPHLSKYEWHQNGTQYTWLWVWLGIGAMTGSTLYSKLTNRFPAYQVIGGSCMLLGICLVGLGMVPVGFGIYLLLFLIGAGWIYATSTLNILAQLYSPKRFKGRFLAINVTIFQGSMALASLFWGYLPQQTGTLGAIRLCGIGMAAVSLLLLFFPMREPETAVADQVACTDPILIETAK